MELGIIVTLAAVLLTAAAVLVIVLCIRAKMRSLSQSMFGTDSFIDGVKQQKLQMSETPKSIHAMTDIYLPQILRDFPEFDYGLYKSKAQSLLKSYFTAINTKSAAALSEECSLTLKNNVQSIIEDLNSRGLKQYFNGAQMHDTQIARYIKDGKTVTIRFEISLGYYSYTEDDKGNVIEGDKELKTQTIYSLDLMYVQDADAVGAGAEAVGINCPNCGAPIKNLGEKFCEYCGGGVVEVNLRAWKWTTIQLTINN